MKEPKIKQPKRDAFGNTAEERKASRAEYKEFLKRPGEAERVKAHKKEMKAKYGEPGRITRGPNKGLMKGTGKTKG